MLSNKPSEWQLTPEQVSVIEQPENARIFLEGPAGAGKTTVGVERLLELMARGIPGNEILLLVPQRTLAGPYYAALQHPGVVAGGMVTVSTIGGLAQRSIELFWPLAGEAAGFARPDAPPSFLNMETAQYFMARLIGPLLRQGMFESVTLERNRLYSQILDNLNKAAVVGFPYTDIGTRLQSAWIGDPGQLHIYEDVQRAAGLFREYCLENNLLDFSLQIDVFRRFIWPLESARGFLTGTYRHLIADNLEEDAPIAHDILAEWLPDCESALLIYDQQAGYRRFLGADPQTAYALKEICPTRIELNHSFVTSDHVETLGASLWEALKTNVSVPPPEPLKPAGDGVGPQTGKGYGEVRAALDFGYQRYFPQMLDWVAEKIAALVHEDGVSPGEIVVLAPILSDALRFSLTTRLSALGIPSRSHRPSRSLRDEPVTQCLLTLATLAFPHWVRGAGESLRPSRFDVAQALMQAIDGMDLVRAQLLSEIVYRPSGSETGLPELGSFDRIRPEMQERITFRLGERFERLRLWLEEAGRQVPPDEPDHFLSRLFGEVLSQPGFGFHEKSDGSPNYEAGETAANLIDSIQSFRWAAGDVLDAEGVPIGQEYLRMVKDGVIAAQYMRSWQAQQEEAVLLAPAYTFLLSNRPVEVQFWLDVGSRGWFERLYQPLTHPFVLTRQWNPGRVWTDVDEVSANAEVLGRLVLGLIRRCRWRVFLGMSELNEQGYEQRGPLMRAFQRVLQAASEPAS